MRSPHQIIVRPLMTEKAVDQLDRNNVYSFVVARDANKIEIRRAVETLFGVAVTDVRTIQYRGKKRRVGRHVGQRAAWKKAMVTLRAGDTIEIFEGV